MVIWLHSFVISIIISVQVQMSRFVSFFPKLLLIRSEINLLNLHKRNDSRSFRAIVDRLPRQRLQVGVTKGEMRSPSVTAFRYILPMHLKCAFFSFSPSNATCSPKHCRNKRTLSVYHFCQTIKQLSSFPNLL